MAAVLAQDGSFGFSLQAEKGTYTTPGTWLPLARGGADGRGETLQWMKNYVTLDLADNNDFESRYFSAGEWVEGRLTVPLIPGSLSELLSWVQGRDAENQGLWASIIVDCVHEVKKVTDAKVRRMTLELAKGQPALCTLDIAALKMESGTAGSPTMPTAPPYLYREAAIAIASGGDTLAEDSACERLRIVIDTMVEDPAEGLRLVPDKHPQQLYNLSGLRCHGTISRDFTDTALYDDFRNGQEAALTVDLSRGAAVASLSLPRILYTQSDLGLPGSHEKRIVETVQFIALGSSDGLTPPIILT